MHLCPWCDADCDCLGDIDDIDTGPQPDCQHCCETEDESEDPDVCGCDYDDCTCQAVTRNEVCQRCRQGFHQYEVEG
jgi:hypothetical protein